ncbi:hypothetical protein BJY01DRAFT_249748 [Aspergillus pseudoustus]|uniref:Cytochrome P450 n=1 Tax=Aspergillus pseudoustus TaxID=1810923 RepID=A0ABR4JLW9_9EURO
MLETRRSISKRPARRIEGLPVKSLPVRQLLPRIPHPYFFTQLDQAVSWHKDPVFVRVAGRGERKKLVIDAPIASGVRYTFYASLAYGGAPENKKSLAFVMQSHLDTKLYLEECARQHEVGFTVVRQGLYTESLPMQLSFFNAKNPVDEISIPHDGPGPGISWVKQAELARRFMELNYRQVVEILSKIKGRQTRIKVISDEEWAAIQPVKDNLTYGNVEYALTMTPVFEAIRHGEAAAISPLLRELLGREPETFETTASEMAQNTSEGHTFWSEYISSGLGARTCIGKNISLLEISKLLPQLLQPFDSVPAGRPEWTTSSE